MKQMLVDSMTQISENMVDSACDKGAIICYHGGTINA